MPPVVFRPFPTRRSSDLSSPGSSAAKPALPPRPSHSLVSGHFFQHKKWVDRKSTRLNSSHLGISYAAGGLQAFPYTTLFRSILAWLQRGKTRAAAEV